MELTTDSESSRFKQTEEQEINLRDQLAFKEEELLSARKISHDSQAKVVPFDVYLLVMSSAEQQISIV